MRRNINTAMEQYVYISVNIYIYTYLEVFDVVEKLDE